MRRPILRLLSSFRPGRAETELAREIDGHLRLLEDKFIAEGMSPQEARYAARRAFGGVDQVKEQQRDERSFRMLDNCWLDLKLGVRMLVKYRGLTLVAAVTLAVAIGVGATFFEAITEALYPDFPLEQGEQVVALQYLADTGNAERRLLHDFGIWRDELVSIQQVSAFRSLEVNLSDSKNHPEPVSAAEMTASGFLIARTPPLLGRYLLPEDERPGAAAVVVLGYEVWQARFGGDPRIVGETIRLSGVPHTVVGVMPAGFRFPVRHQCWTPLREDPLAHKRLQGPPIYVFGRLSAGATPETAEAELATIAQRQAAESPQAYPRLRPRVLPYTREHVELDDPAVVWAMWMIAAVVSALVMVVGINLAVLIYARTVARSAEIAVRTALGASRRRILGQLFLEAWALAMLGASLGLVLADFVLTRIQGLIESSGGSLPFWISLRLSPLTIVYALALALLTAVIMGVAPGVKATRGDLHAGLRELSGSRGPRLGRTWTALIVGQVAVAVALLPLAMFMVWEVAEMELSPPAFPASQYVVAQLDINNENAPAEPRTRRELSRVHQLEVLEQTAADAGVAGVSFSSFVPGFGPGGSIEFEKRLTANGAPTAGVMYFHAEPSIFELYGARILAGGGLEREGENAAKPAVVNRTFAQRLLGNRNVLGQRFRYLLSPGQQLSEWHEIVGVVEDFPAFPPQPGSEGEPELYHPAAPGDFERIVLSIRLHGDDTAGIIGRLRDFEYRSGRQLRIHNSMPLSDYYEDVRSLWRSLAGAIASVTLSVLLLSAAGMYALTSFTVAQRTREIAIRSALGAHPRQILRNILGRVARQVAAGVLIGASISTALLFTSGMPAQRASVLLLVVAVVIVAIGLGAALTPAKRGLNVQPIDVLRADA